MSRWYVSYNDEDEFKRNYVNDGRDFFNKELKAGDVVIRAQSSGMTTQLEHRIVSRVEGNMVYLNPNANTCKEYEENKQYLKPPRDTRVMFSGRLCKIS